MSRSQVRRPAGFVGFGDDDSSCPILHGDMDAVYASVELRTRPELIGQPVIVGGGGGRGVVLSATYEARALGIHSAMPIARAHRIAPQAIFIEPTHGLYSEVSAGVMEIFESITPIVEPLSLDEAFLDVSGALRRLGTPTSIAHLIRARVVAEQGITCSVGVASTKFVAKLASTRSKPDGLLVIPIDKVLAFLHPLPVGALWGVGERTEESLHRLGLRTVGDIAHTPLDTMKRALGEAAGVQLHELSWGRDNRSVTPHQPDKSIGNESTFNQDVDDPDVILRHLMRLSDQVAGRMRNAGHVGRTVSIKIRFADFSTITRSRTLQVPTDTAKEIFDVARGLYEALGLQRVRIRLVGVRMEGLDDASEAPHQMTFDEPAHGHRDAEVAIDALRSRFGATAVQPGRLTPGKTEQKGQE